MLRAALICALLVGLGACTGEQRVPEAPEADARSSPSGETPARTPSSELQPSPDPLVGVYEEYVALGDSYTAGPLIEPDDPRDDACGRSLVNYPRLLGQRLQVEVLRDVSCSGADTTHLRSPQSGPFGTSAPQLRALTPSTDLVTLGIGGNDFGVFSRLVTGCARARAQNPGGAPCRQELSGITDVFGRTETRVADGLQAIRTRAPEAEVLVVGYPRLAPERGTCPDELPFAAGDYAFAHEVLQELNAALRRAAASTGARFVDVAGPAEGHSACAGEDAWVNGRRTEAGKALSYHPLEEGMVAVADLVYAELR